MSGPLRVVVCGTTFGRVHLAALRRPGSPVVLAGILARGSARSRACAEQYQVPLYRGVAELPDDVDAACVAVRAGVVGGDGSTLAAALLNRGIHVLQEHPLHHDELAQCLRLARQQRLVYQLNNHYLQVPAVRQLVSATRALYRHGPPRYVDAAAGIQVAYALFDILGRALPSLRPWGFTDPPLWPDELRRLTESTPPLQPLQGVLGGVPVTLRIHNQLDPADPDNHAHLLHRVSIGTDAGNLTLLNTHGPVVWSGRMHVADPAASGEAELVDPRLRSPSASPLGDPGGPSFADIISTQWPDAMAATLADFAAAIRRQEDPLRLGQYHLTVTRIWQDVTSRLGQPELVAGAAPPQLTSAELLAAPAGVDR